MITLVPSAGLANRIRAISSARCLADETGHDLTVIWQNHRRLAAPTARRVLDAFGNVDRHELGQRGQPTTELVTELSPLQRKILALFDVPPNSYGHRRAAGGKKATTSGRKKSRRVEPQ